MEETKTYFAETDKDKLAVDTVFQGRSKRVVIRGEESDYQNFIDANICLTVFKDGALSLFNQDGDGSVYFYPEQLKHLRTALDFAMLVSEENT